MMNQFDTKGKIFTQVISKKPVNVIIRTGEHLIKGIVHVRPNERLKDELNMPETFVAITNAIVYDTQGKELYRCGFLTLNVSHIRWIIPEEEIIEPKADEA